MKTKFFSLLAACLFAGSLFADNLFGKVQGVESGSIIIYKFDLSKGKALKPDTVALKDGTFSVTLPESLLRINIMAKPTGNSMPALMMTARNSYIYNPGDQLRVNGDIHSLTPSGTRLYEELGACREVNELWAKADSVQRAMGPYYRDQEKNKEVLNRMLTQLKGILADQVVAAKEVVARQPGSLAAAYLVTQMPLPDAVAQMDKLSPEIRQGTFKPVFEKLRNDYELAQKRAEAQKSLVPGMKVPDFRLRDIKGQECTLADFKGKYVLLDFWGTWCGWCIKGIPQMKEYYEKYKSLVEFVGICCNDTEDKWRNGVSKYTLPWTNLYNGYDREVTTLYAVSGYPTKVLIDPEGNLVQIFVGESQELYQKLDQLFTNL